MYIYKINNVMNKFGKLDYKGIDLKKNYGQLYPLDLTKDNWCIVCNDEYYEHEDLELITEEEYNAIKQQIKEEYENLSKTKEKITEQEIQTLKQSITELTAIVSMLTTPTETE